jgi:hypothetical protein
VYAMILSRMLRFKAWRAIWYTFWILVALSTLLYWSGHQAIGQAFGSIAWPFALVGCYLWIRHRAVAIADAVAWIRARRVGAQRKK